MSIHPAVAARFHLLDGIPSIQAAMGDPELDRKFREFASPELFPAPEALTQDLLLDGPHGPVPVRVYEPVDRVLNLMAASVADTTTVPAS